MKHLYPKPFISSLLIFILTIITFQPVAAQCPAGSVSNAPGVYANGNVVCISTNVSGNIKLNNGAKMVIVSGGNFTGDFDGNSGSIIEVKAGGTFKPGNANNLASAITVDKSGTAIFGTGGLTLSNGFSLSNFGTATWSSSPTIGNAITITNTSCGSMNFNQNVTLQNGATLNNSGILTIQNLITDVGSKIDNRGRLTVKGDFAPKGYLKNQWQAVFLGTNNNMNSGADSIINLYTMVFKNAINGTMYVRNEGLFWFGGSLQLGTGSGIKMTRTNAQLRVSGAFTNNAAVSGNGKLHVAGGFANNGTLTGKSASEKLSLNQNMATGVTNTQYNAAMTADDTTGYAGGAGNPDVSCATLLPMVVSSLKGNYYDNAVNLTWYTLTEINGKKFDVEYSTDGLSFTKAGEVAAKGNSVERVNYQFRFTKITANTLYFRLLMVDLNGRTEYTNMITVKTTAGQQITASVYPNPFVETLDVTLILPKTSPITVKLMDMNGRTVKTQMYTGQAGSNKFSLTGLGQLNKGLFVVEVAAGEIKWMQKVLR
ncbi:T9SS type A sorting domain-containing protein [Paraflavitalea soli]|nr:T9SS type A sorting domain-containing protein [Paraflavitalea soli]